MATYSEAKAISERLTAEVDRLGAILKAFPATGPMGLVPDAIKFSPEYRAAKANFDFALKKLRDFNGTFVKTFSKEIAQERRNRFAKATS